MTKIQVPAGMLGAVEMYVNSQDGRGYAMPLLEAALQWLIKALDDMRVESNVANSVGYNEALEDVRMFLAEPEIPEEVKDLLHPTEWTDGSGLARGPVSIRSELANEHLIEAFRRGRSKGSVSLPEPEKGSIFYRERSKG